MVRAVEILVGLEWSVLCAFPHGVGLDHGVCGVYEYTPRFVIDMIYMFCMTYVICHEFWVPVRPTQNCAGVIMLFFTCYNYFTVSLSDSA